MTKKVTLLCDKKVTFVSKSLISKNVIYFFLSYVFTLFKNPYCFNKS